MFKHLDEKYVEFFIRSLRLSNLFIEFPGNSQKFEKKGCEKKGWEPVLVSKERKPNLVFLTLENRKFLINVANYCYKSIRLHLSNHILKQKILEKITNERKL